MEIPDFLLTQVREGKVVLFLGLGASMDATDGEGKKPPSASALADMLADRFLAGKYKGYPLNQIAEYAINESDLGTVQAFIRDIFAPFEPSKAHELMTTFRWDGLATTNYDQIIEKAYSKNSAVQEPRSLIENTDRVEENLRDPKSILLLKLHGCISRISNPTCPAQFSLPNSMSSTGRVVIAFLTFSRRGVTNTRLFSLDTVCRTLTSVPFCWNSRRSVISDLVILLSLLMWMTSRRDFGRRSASRP